MNKKSTPFKLLFLSSLFAVPTLLSAQNYEQIVAEYLNSDSSQLKSKSIKSKEFTISNVDNSESMGGAVLQVQQTYNSIPVYQGLSTFFVKNNEVEYAKENFVSNLQALKTKRVSKSSINEEELAQLLFPELLSNTKIKSSSAYTFTEKKDVKNRVDSKLVYFPRKGELILAMEFDFEEENTSNYWHVLMDIETKEILFKENLTLFCQFGEGAFTHDNHLGHEPLQQINTLLYNDKEQKSDYDNTVTDARYNVFPFPVEAPTFGGRRIVSEDRSISRDGWHYDGTTSYTITRGNNVFAYENLMDTNDPSYVLDAGKSLLFDYPLTISADIDSYRDAVITNLFYANNKIHDVFYKFGFTESARNFQKNNYRLGGFGDDHILAEVRTGYGKNSSDYINNASFGATADGFSPNMRMYHWNPVSVPQRVTFNAPSDFIGFDIETRSINVGPFSIVTPIVGDLVKSEPANGCTALTNDLTDKIAFIERGDCTFAVKIKNAQDAGAKVVLVYNVDSTQTLSNVGGKDDTITIPAALTSLQDGQRILSSLDSGINVNISYQDDKSKYVWIDSGLDNGVIIHEYGHGISNRLTGSGFLCLLPDLSNEQMDEGWSDFFALMLTNRPGDDASVARGMGSFVEGEEADGPGLRPAKYSPDFNVNNYTYGRTNGMTVVTSSGTVPHVHSIGFVWATMLWDLHWKFADRYGYSSDVVNNPESGSAKVLQLVVDGLKLQPCNPTFIDGRDAILEADRIKGGADRCMIWEAFAKRGLGVNASAGEKVGVTTGINDQVEDFTIPESCELSTKDLKIDSNVSIYPNPARNEITLSSKTIKGNVNIQLFDISGRKVLEVNETISSGAKLDVSKLPNGVYILKGKGIDANFSQKLIIKK